MTHDSATHNINRRKLILAAVAAAPVVVLAALPAEAAKVSQASVGYVAHPNAGHACGGCKLYEAPTACKLVAGKISPAGWCQLWVAKA